MNLGANYNIENPPNKPSTKVVAISGELDENNLPELKEKLTPIIDDPGISTLIFNFNGLEFMSSSVVGFFTALQADLDEKNRKVVFTNCNQTIKDIITFVGLTQIISCYLTVDEAIEMSNSSGSDKEKPKSNT